MGGVSIDSGKAGGRRSLDSEINMIPMIDLLMVTISFLLITAVWSHMSRINADARVPGDTHEPVMRPPEKQLHVEMRSPDKFTLVWRQGGAVIGEPIDVPRKSPETPVREGQSESFRYPELAAKIESEWKASGLHRGDDAALDQAVLHTDNETQYAKLIGVVDAIYRPRRPVTGHGASKPELVSVFNVTFAVN